MVADFPNLFTIVGPNTASGHYSIIFMAECNIEFAIRLMKPFLKSGKPGSIEVKEEAEKRDVDWVQERLKQYIWHNSEETGWYVDKKTGHNGTVYPHFQLHYMFKTLIPRWNDFILHGVSKPKPFRVILIVLALLGILIAWLLVATKIFKA